MVVQRVMLEKWGMWGRRRRSAGDIVLIAAGAGPAGGALPVVLAAVFDVALASEHAFSRMRLWEKRRTATRISSCCCSSMQISCSCSSLMLTME